MILRFFNIFKTFNEEDRRLISCVKQITGYKPFRLELYRLATIHSSVASVNSKGFRESNERLEYLGDAILGAVVAEYLFKLYPYKDEGFLTEIRSRIVNRESLNLLARKIGLDKMVQVEKRRNYFSHKSIHGDMLEAFVGAVYLDRGYKRCRRFIIKRLVKAHFDLDTLIKTNNNYKSILIEWAQRHNKIVDFEVEENKTSEGFKEFIAKVFIDQDEISEGIAINKKKAEQSAAFKACGLLGVIEED